MHDFTVGELWSNMGPLARAVVYVLAVMSAAAVTVAVERAVSFARSARASRRFARGLALTVEEAGVRGAAHFRLDGEGGHLGRVLTAGLAAYRKASTAGAPAELMVDSVARALERQTARELESLRRGVSLLATVGSTAPFVGLLGTVIGIVNAFRLMAASGSGGLGTVSAGIAEALVTTAFGLVVAIPAVAAYNALQGWIESRGVDLAESSNELLDLVACERGAAPAGDAEVVAARRARSV